jgi:hypothetical protein
MSRHVTVMTIDDAEHYTPAQRAQIIASYPEAEREARAKGVPVLGSGRVFPVDETKLRVDPFPVPKYWAHLIGIDFGWDHPFGAAKIAWDRDADVIYVTACYRERQATPPIHAAAIRPWGERIPVAWPHDGLQHDKSSGQQLKDQYVKQGLNMWQEHATHEAGGFGIEAGISEMLERMQTGRFKVFSTLNEWFEEFRLYHRKDGIIVKLADDILSATRIAVMMRRFAAPIGTDTRERRFNDYGDDSGNVDSFKVL